MPEMYAHHKKLVRTFSKCSLFRKNMKIMAMLDAVIKSSKSGKRGKICD
ncbi:MAG: hypothetical protein L6V93_11370 [Clostridiales bacterium]|nr:MAG: hypothetical protein L6V93_11370 [Clostridiales bacterium]